MKYTFFFVLLLFVSPVFAQEDWKIKDFDKWNAKDVETILNNSAWVKSQEVRLQYENRTTAVAGSVVGNVSLAPSIGNTVGVGSISPAVDFTFILRLRSSLAIRLALIRKNQLETKVENLSAKERELFQQKQKGLYECPACAENYVVTVTSKSRENKGADAIFSTFAGARFDDIKRYIYLQNDKGEKRELAHFTPPKVPGDEATFFFKRFDDKNNLLFTKDSKYLILNLTNNQVNTATNFKIEIAPLIVGDRVDF
ncbi:MAG: hypothetical protein H0W58_05785 [Acidobacteria bacterium]|jgi:hypothetical protein|nr:hypothetical protein [Acidobacteriota bacterium]